MTSKAPAGTVEQLTQDLLKRLNRSNIGGPLCDAQAWDDAAALATLIQSARDAGGKAGIEEERERLAQLADDMALFTGVDVAMAIRALVKT